MPRTIAARGSSPAIETRGLTKVYRQGPFGGRVKALDSLNLRVEPGEVFGFLGANGAGKTTTIKLLLRLAFPTAGEAHLLGHRVPHTPTRARIGYLPENPYFYDYATPDDLLNLYADIFGIPPKGRETRIGGALERVRMERWRRTPLKSFSKGMVQRIGVAQALLNDPELLLLDEPTSGLDPVGRAEMRDLILDLRERGKTVFVNSHQLMEIEAICDRVAILRKGRLALQGRLDDLLASEGIEVLAEGVPADLADRLRAAGHALSPEEARAETARAETARAEETSVTTDAAGRRLRIGLASQAEVRPVVEALFARDATLLSVTPRRKRLEDLFLQVEGEEEPAPGQRATGENEGTRP